MPEETKNAAVSGEWKLVPMAQLKKWHRDLDACQKVMWLRGGFDPAYCMDAQDCLKEMDSVLAASVPPAGGEVEVLSYLYRHPAGEPWPRTYSTRQHGLTEWVETELADRAHVTRLQAENAALQHRLTIADQRVDDLTAERDELSAGAESMDRMVSTIAKAVGDDTGLMWMKIQQAFLVEIPKLQSDIAAARELLKHGSSPTPAHCESVLDFLAGQSAPAAKGGER